MKLRAGRMNFSITGIYHFMLMVQICAVSFAHAQQFNFKGGRNKDAISFSLVKNLVIVPLYINGKGPFNFILDTGVGPMIITDPHLMDSLNLKAVRSMKISGLGKGNEIDAFVSNEVSVKIGRASIDHIPTAILKTDIFGLSGYLGTKIYGLLGYYFFNSFVVDIRYASRRLRFSDPGVRRKIKGEKIPIELIAYKPYINISIESAGQDKANIKALVDNGASHAISLERLEEKPFPVPSTAIRANLGVGMSGPIDGHIARLTALKIGRYTLRNVLANYPEYDDVAAKVLLKERNGNLGADILSRFNVVFDYNGKAMYVKKGAHFNRPFEHDMAGIELYTQEDKTRHYFVSRIEPGSPAEEAGILAEDEIVTINFQPASSYTLNEVTNLFKSADRKTIFLSIYRNKELTVKVFKLKQRI